MNTMAVSGIKAPLIWLEFYPIFAAELSVFSYP
jgi:hypothetical protein